jgi:hypothetical protein
VGVSVCECEWPAPLAAVGWPLSGMAVSSNAAAAAAAAPPSCSSTAQAARCALSSRTNTPRTTALHWPRQEDPARVVNMTNATVLVAGLGLGLGLG